MTTKVDILAFGAHPDDVELSCAGTLISHIKKGYSVGLIDLTRGELGSRGSAQLRTKEANTSAQIMGAKYRENLDLRDGLFEINEESLLKVISILRKYQPKIVFANAIKDRHPDHSRGAELIHRAAFLSGLIKIETLLNGKPQTLWRPKLIYHYIQDQDLKPDLVHDVSQEFDQKMKCILSFKSQFYDPQSSAPITPISGKEFLEFIKAKARNFGRPIGAEYAEGFIVKKTIGIEDFMRIS